MPAIDTPPAPTTEAPKSPGSLTSFDTAFNDLDEPSPSPSPEPTPEPTPEPGASPSPEPKPEPAKDPVTGKFVPKPDAKPQPKADPKPDTKAQPKPDVKPTDEYTPPAVATGTALRKFAMEAGNKARQANQELSRLRSEVEKLKATPREDTSAVVQELASAKKRLEQYENEARLTRYERSEEYRTKYEQPYQNAVKQAYSDVKELLVTEPNPADPDNPKERQATAADFDEIYNLPLGPATKLATSKFGTSAMIVLNHRQAIKNAAKSAVEAIEANKGKATEYEQQQTAAQKMQQEASSQMFSTAIEDLQTKYPDRFSERDGDTEWNESRTKGLAMADLAFGDRKGLTPQQSAILDAQIHIRAAHYAAERIMRVRLEKEVSQLKADLEKIRGSAPGAVQPSGKAPETKSKDWRDQFDKAIPE